MVLAQQVQASDGSFHLRPWNPFSESHEITVDNEDAIANRKENESP